MLNKFYFLGFCKSGSYLNIRENFSYADGIELNATKNTLKQFNKKKGEKKVADIKCESYWKIRIWQIFSKYCWCKMKHKLKEKYIFKELYIMSQYSTL